MAVAWGVAVEARPARRLRDGLESAARVCLCLAASEAHQGSPQRLKVLVRWQEWSPLAPTVSAWTATGSLGSALSGGGVWAAPIECLGRR